MALPVHAASFDCAKASSTFEHVICGQRDAADHSNLTEPQRQELIKLDDELNTVYRDTLAQYFDSALLRREQLAWLKARERCVRDTYCSLLSLYNDRIDNLRYDIAHPPKTPEEQANARLFSMGSPSGDNFKFDRDATEKGYGFGVCEALVRWINHATPKGYMDSPYRIVRNMPGISDPPWEELNISEHKELFANLVKAELEHEGVTVMPDSKKIQKEIVRGLAGEYKLWVVKEDLDRNGKPKTLAVYSPLSDPIYPDLKKWGWPQIVTDDLRGVEKQTTLNYLMPFGSFILHYRDNPYVIALGNNVIYFRGYYAACTVNGYKERAK